MSYWRKGNQEVDFVVRQGKITWAIEVKSGISGNNGLHAFRRVYPEAEVLLIGADGIPLEEFLSGSVQRWFR